MANIIRECPSLTPDVLERPTVVRNAHFLALLGHPVLFRLKICLDSENS